MVEMTLDRDARDTRHKIFRCRVAIGCVVSVVSILGLDYTTPVLANETEKDIAPSFTLPDSNQGLVRVKWPREKPVFLTFGEQASQTQILAWSERMKADYAGQVEFIGIAWLEAVPESMHAAAETVIRTTRPDVLVDKTGSCADRYRCKAGAVNAFVIAPDGVVLKRIHEELTEERYQAVRDALEPFLEPGANAPSNEEGQKQ